MWFNTPRNLAKVVVGYEADLGLAYDGDADRLIAVDKFGNVIDGDKIIGILALGMKNKGTLKNNKVVTTVMSNIGFEKYLKENDIELLRANVGDRNVLEKNVSRRYCYWWRAIRTYHFKRLCYNRRWCVIIFKTCRNY